MRMVLQRVREASVRVEGDVVGQIGKGILVLLGVHRNDTSEDIPWMVQKLLNLRIFNDPKGKINLNVREVLGQILVVSQFTLYADCDNGRRPDFIEAAAPLPARELYELFAAQVAAQMGGVQTGLFGAKMDVSLLNDGPFTLIVDSPQR